MSADGVPVQDGGRAPLWGQLSDVPGVLVGHVAPRRNGWLTGVTVVLVPIVPAAAVFDLGRGGDPSAVPDLAMG